VSLLKATVGIEILLLVLVTAIVWPRNHTIVMLTSIPVLFVALWFMQATVRVFDFRHPTIPGVWFFCYVLMCWVPSLLIFMEITPEGYSYPIYVGPHLSVFLFATTSVLVAVPLGIWFTNWLFQFKATEVAAYFKHPLRESTEVSRSYIYLLSVTLALTALYFYEVKELPLTAMLKDPGNFAYLAVLREESFVGLDSHFVYAYSVLREALYPFLIALALAKYLYTKQRKWLLLLLVSLSAGVMFASVSIARGPVATILLVVSACWYLCRRGRVSIKHGAIAIILILAFPIFVSLFSSSIDATLSDALRIVFVRLCYGPAYVAYVYFEVIPKEVQFQYGAATGKVAWLLGRQHFDASKYVLFTIYPDALETGSAGGAFFADFYANFGIPGVVAGGVLIGAIMQSIQILLIRRKKTAASIAAYAFMFYAFYMTTSRPLPTVLLSTGVIFVLGFWWFMAAFDERLSLHLKN
jgi:oligosaccharide repeat unit polymerase